MSVTSKKDSTMKVNRESNKHWRDNSDKTVRLNGVMTTSFSLGTRNSADYKAYECPAVKIKNICCVCCKKVFNKDNRYTKQPVIPLVRCCGHPICDACSNSQAPCPICQDGDEKPASETNGMLVEKMPLNIYVLGLLNANKPKQNPTTSTNDPDLTFRQPLAVKAQKATVAERCIECGQAAVLKCVTCKSVLFCHRCYGRSHQFKAYKDHKVISLNDDYTVSLPLFCDEHKEARWNAWCEDCEMTCCTDCMLDNHQRHTTVRLREKNLNLLEELYEVYDILHETLQRTKDSKKKVTESLKAPQESSLIAKVEAEINQHFLHLHGLLQNKERKIIGILRGQSDNKERTLQEFQKELESTEKEIENGILIARAVQYNFDSVNLFDVLRKLGALADARCYFAQTPTKFEEHMQFHVDKNFVKSLEAHCELEVLGNPTTYHLGFAHEDPDDEEVLYEGPMLPLFDDPDFVKKVTMDFSRSISPQTETSETPQINQKLLPMPEPVERKDHFDVYVTHIENPSNFYVRHAANNAKWIAVKNHLKGYEEYSRPVPEEIKIRKLYAVNVDEEWHRGVIIGIVPDREKNIKKYEVQFIDIGNQEKGVLKQQIRELDESLKGLEPLAENCSLYETFPRNSDTWSPKATTKMKEIIAEAVDSPVIMKKITPMSNGVEIIVPSKRKGITQSVRDSLHYQELATLMSRESALKIIPDSCAILNVDVLEEEDFYQVYLASDDGASIVNPNCFYVRRSMYSESAFMKMMKELKEDYDASYHRRSTIYAPQIGMICAVQFNDRWYRATISALPGNKMVDVFFVDYGVSKVVKYKAIRQLDPCYMREATRAIKTSLKDVEPVDGVWSAEANQQLQQWMKNSVKLICHGKKDDSYLVCLRDSETDENLNKKLVRLGLAKSSGAWSRSSKPWAKPVTNRKIGRVKVSKEAVEKSPSPELSPTTAKNTFTKEIEETRRALKKHEAKDLNRGDPWKVNVHPKKVISPDEIYVALTDETERYDEMNKRLQRIYKRFSPMDVPEWQVGSCCVVYLKNSQAYRRASIIEMISADEVKVLLLDIGEVVIVSISDLHRLFSVFSEVPSTILKVKLGGLHPPCGSDRWPEASIQYLQDIIDDNDKCRFFIAQVAEAEENGALVVEMFVERQVCKSATEPTIREIEDINHMLIDKGVALSVKGFNETKIKILGADVCQELEIGIKNPAEEEDYFEEDIDESDDAGDGMHHAKPNVKILRSDAHDAPDYQPIAFANYNFKKGTRCWPAAEPIAENQFECEGYFVDWKCFIYVQTDEAMEKAKIIEEELQKHYEKSYEFCDISEWKHGDLCIAKMHTFNKWYRGQVLGRKDRFLVILFSDYGNLEWIPYQNVRKELIFEDMPVLVTKCQIHRMISCNSRRQFIEAELNQIHHAIVQRRWKAEIVQRHDDYYVVRIKHPEPPYENVLFDLKRKYNVDIDLDQVSESDETSSDAVIQEAEENDDEMEKATSIIEDDLDAQFISEDGEDDDENCETSSLLRENLVIKHFANTSEIYPHCIFPEELRVCRGALGEVNRDDPSIVYIHICEAPGSEALTVIYKLYQDMMQRMNEEAEYQPQLENFTYGTPCCAIYELDQHWYRCTVKSSISEGSNVLVQVCFVDWGNTEWVRSEFLREPKPEWLKVPSMALKCRLYGIRVCDNSSEVSEFLKTLGTMKMQPLTVSVEARVGNEVQVQLWVNKERTMLLYQRLLDNGQFKITDIEDEEVEGDMDEMEDEDVVIEREETDGGELGADELGFVDCD